jgi:hypothetical protein
MRDRFWLAGQLPDSIEDALMVLRATQEILEDFLTPKAEPAEPCPRKCSPFSERIGPPVTLEGSSKKSLRFVNFRTDVAAFSCFNIGVSERIYICIRPVADPRPPGYSLISGGWFHAAPPILYDTRNGSR